MKIDRLLSMRNAHRKVIDQQLLKIEITKQHETFCEFDIILSGITSKFESVKSLNEKILEQIDVAELDEEMVEAEQHVLDIEIKLGKLKEYRSSKCTEPERQTYTETRRLNPTASEFIPPPRDDLIPTIPAPNNTLPSLRNYYDRLETYIRGLESLGEFQDSYGKLLVPIILNKLPQEIRRNLACENGSDNWLLGDLRSAIRKEITILEASQPTETFHGITASFLAETKEKSHTHAQHKLRYSSQTDIKLCVYCGEPHKPVNCTKLKTTEERTELVKKKRLGKHQVSKCSSSKRCLKCNRKHHTSICNSNTHTSHKSSKTTDSAALHTQTADSEIRYVDTRPDTGIFHSSQKKPNVLLQTAVAPVCYNDTTLDGNILFDLGAQSSFITQSFAQKLGLQPTGSDIIQVASFGDTNKKIQHLDTATVSLITDNGEKISLNVMIVPTIAVPIRNIQRSVTSLPYLRSLKLAHPVTDDEQFEISLLIGADHYWKIVQNKTVRGNGPTAIRSKIGYLLSGPLPVTSNKKDYYMMNVITRPPETDQLERFWKLESLGISAEKDSNRQEVLEEYQQKCISFTNGRYVAKLPWKQDHSPLPTNFDVALKRTQSTIRKLTKEPTHLQRYGEIIKEQEKRGFIERVISPDERTTSRIHYIPHHAVKKDSTTTPIRIVFDCSCRKSAGHPSLNDCLQTTPPELNDLTSILVRFRLNKYAVSTDIEKAFLQVGLHEDDRDVTRFLWLSDPTDANSPFYTYRYKSVLFGATCSPFILGATLLKHLNENAENTVSQVLKRDLYVDNVLSSFEEEKDVLQYFSKARTLMSSANFNLRSWTSNSQKLREIANAQNIFDTDSNTKVLGMRWNSETNEMMFPTKIIHTSTHITKREVLKQTSKIYDPLGLLSPVTVRAKIMLQDICKNKLDWDTELPQTYQIQWKEIAKDLRNITMMSIPRCYFPVSTTNITNGDDKISQKNETLQREDVKCLHIFVDASVQSYGAVAYICKDNRSEFVMAKTRVAPMKPLTVPRLELMAAVIGSRLARHLEEPLQINTIYMWSDSQIALHWISTPKTRKRFVENRVREIQELTKNRKWRYCPTKDNPADLLTRGISAEHFTNNDLWLHGPSWLHDCSNWPTWNMSYSDMTVLATVDENEPEADSQPNETTYTPHTVIDFTRYSKLRKLFRVTAYVLRFIFNCHRTSESRRTGPLTLNEINIAEQRLMRNVQEISYRDEIENIQSKSRRKPLVKQLRFFIDDSNLLRCGGRIHNAPLSEMTKFPYLLPPNHYFTRLVVQDAHERVLHAGASTTITFLRQKYWITSIRQCVKTILRKCVTCRKVSGKAFCSPDPPPLPKNRIEDPTPFKVTGVDFSGALYVKEKSGNESKAYICLFTCASTRAVHLELVSDLTEETFMQAFRRFCSRRTVPKIMISDNASTYLAAANHIKCIFESPTLKENLRDKGTEWQFIPSRAPWYGGWWERLIGLTKTALKKILGRAYVTFDSLHTIITEIEAVLNDRPLTYTESDCSEPEPLTPAHLLYGRRVTELPYPDDPADVINRSTTPKSDLNYVTKRAKTQTQLIERFQSRWRHEYLTALREFHRTTGRNDQTINIGDVVQIHADKPRCRWKLAVIEEVVKGRDGLVRATKIKTDNCVTLHPVTKLYPLEVIS